MHFLGLQGMPRRIPDYPNIYEYWNKIISIGSSITLISLFIFFYILIDLFSNINLLPYKYKNKNKINNINKIKK